MARHGVITDDVIREVRERTDIVQVVGEHVRLIPTGRNFKGLCPFHQEKTPSFVVTPEKQIYHCFGCHKGGDVFSFVMAAERLEFVEAVTRLADRCGVKLATRRDTEHDPHREVWAALAEAAEFYREALKGAGGREARAYLERRGLKSETITEFGIGYAPPEWDALLRRLGQRPEGRAALEAAGLILPRKDGSGFYDRFRHRLMIPIHDQRGRVCAFGGRVIAADDEPKYLNSPDTALFNKRRLLFNLHRALPAIRREESAVVVEGYLDAISLAEAGIGNVVATLGTAITSEQLQLLARNCPTVHFCYDADEAGQRATLRAIEMQRGTPLVARVVRLVETAGGPKEDPDSFVRRAGREAFLARLGEARDIYQFLVDHRLRQLPTPLDITSKDRLVQEFRDLLGDIASPVIRAEVIKMLAAAIQVDVELLTMQLQPRPTTTAPEPRAAPRAARDGENELAEWIIRHLVQDPDQVERVRQRIEPEYFRDPQLRQLYEAVCHLRAAHGSGLAVAELIGRLQDPALESRVSELLLDPGEAPPIPLDQCLNGFVHRNLKRIARILEEKIRAAEQAADENETLRLTGNLMKLKRLEQTMVANP